MEIIGIIWIIFSLGVGYMTGWIMRNSREPKASEVLALFQKTRKCKWDSVEILANWAFSLSGKISSFDFDRMQREIRWLLLKKEKALNYYDRKIYKRGSKSISVFLADGRVKTAKAIADIKEVQKIWPEIEGRFEKMQAQQFLKGSASNE